MKLQFRIGICLLVALLLTASGQQRTTSNGVVNQQSDAGITYQANGTADSGGTIILVTAVSDSLYQLSYGGVLKTVTGTGGVIDLVANCGALTPGTLISNAVDDVTPGQLTNGGGAIAGAYSCALKTGDTLTYEADFLPNPGGTISGFFSVVALRVH